MVVNGSNPMPVSITNWQASVSECSPDGRSSEAVVGSVDSASQVSVTGSELSGEHDPAGQQTPKDSRSESRNDAPMVLNGSGSFNNDNTPLSNSPASNGVLTHPANVPNGLLPTEQLNGPLRLSPNTRNRLARQAQNGGVSPLDIGTGQKENLRDDLPHLSPVYETRTPSPTANRKFEPGMERKANGVASKRTEEEQENAKVVQKPGSVASNQTKPVLATSKSTGHTRSSKSESAAPGNWQRIPKGKNKVAGTDTKTGYGQAFGEKLPSNDSERKGG
jgi:hypothetical protein